MPSLVFIGSDAAPFNRLSNSSWLGPDPKPTTYKIKLGQSNQQLDLLPIYRIS